MLRHIEDKKPSPTILDPSQRLIQSLNLRLPMDQSNSKDQPAQAIRGLSLLDTEVQNPSLIKGPRSKPTLDQNQRPIKGSFKSEDFVEL